MIVNCHSYYSLRYGTLSIRELVDFAKEYGISTLALTDINNTSAALDFVRYAKSHGIKSVIGVEFRNSGELLYTALAWADEHLAIYASHPPNMRVPPQSPRLASQSA